MKTSRIFIVASLLLLLPFIASAQMTYAITDVRVVHGNADEIAQLRRAGFRPLIENGCVSPSDPAVISNIDPANVNNGIGGDTVSVWAQYLYLPTNSDHRVLVDLAVTNWPNWEVMCPAGFEKANGDPQLTTRTNGPCNRNGLCVKYAPLKETAQSTIVTALYLSRGTNAEAALACGGAQCPGNTGSWTMTASGEDIHKGCGKEKDGRVWVYVCRNQELRTAAKAPKDFASVSAEQKLRLMKLYAPRVYLAQGEQYFPSNVEWSFANMVRYTSADDGSFWLTTKEKFELTDTLNYWYGFKDGQTAPVYAFWVDKADAYQEPFVDLVYFTYYPYNLGKAVAGVTWGNHVGDWEHATVRLAWRYEAGWILKPVAMYLPAHDDGMTVKWIDVATFEITHPIVYAAYGSHGLWPTEGSHKYKTVGGGTIDLIDVTSAGTAWNTWNSLIAWDYRNQTPLTGVSWPAWMSTDYKNPGTGDAKNPAAGPIYRWGNKQRICPGIGVCRLEDGPTGPPDKNVWASGVFQ